MQATMSKTILTESFPQHLLVISKALPPFYVERSHDKVFALYKYPTNCCKNNLESSTPPKEGYLFLVWYDYSFINFQFTLLAEEILQFAAAYFYN